MDILDREVGSTGAKYRVLVNRVDTSNPDRPEHQPDKIVLLISNQWHINCTSSDSN
ncbi:tail fiber assembly protein [Salmonella enterica]|nr:tail fiber assembly protein [Salmonella enterica]